MLKSKHRFHRKEDFDMKKNVLQNTMLESSFCGCGREAASFLTQDFLMDEAFWKKFVQVFRDQQDGDNLGWRGEYWGKMMRGAVMTYECSYDQELYRVMTDTVRDLLTVAEADGRVSSYRREHELDGWDMWCRKYVLLGLEYYYDVCKDEALKAEIVSFLCGCADAILTVVGDGEGKRTILQTGKSWGGLNSSSILEPFVRLYAMTNEKRYLDFSEHIVRMGGSSMANIFEMAYENKLYPYQYGVAKAYEMISNFEGLIEYYMVTGIEKYKTATVNFAKALIDSDVSVIGSLGATHELLDHTKNRQTAYTDVVRQETCVTVTWMKFCARLFRLTGETIFADQVEQAFFNAYRGALNTEHKSYPKYLHDKCIVRLGLDRYQDTILPVDSYSPLTPGKRGIQIGGHQMLPDRTFYGCCACISAAGIGSYLTNAVLCDEEGIIVSFFEPGAVKSIYRGEEISVAITTDYPRTGNVKIVVRKNTNDAVQCRIRIPAWTIDDYTVNVAHNLCDGYACMTLCEKETVIDLSFDMQIRVVKPVVWDTDIVYTDRSLTTKTAFLAGPMKIEHKPEDDQYVCLMRGPITLAADSRMGKDAASKFSFQTENGAPVFRLFDQNDCLPNVKTLVHVVLKDADGNDFSLVDYGSAGRDWETVITAWLPV